MEGGRITDPWLCRRFRCASDDARHNPPSRHRPAERLRPAEVGSGGRSFDKAHTVKREIIDKNTRYPECESLDSG